MMKYSNSTSASYKYLLRINILMNQVYCSDPLFKVFLFASLSKIHRNQNLIKKTKTKSIQQPQNLLKKSWIFVFFMEEC